MPPQRSSGLFTHHPFKFLYTTFFLAALPLRLFTILTASILPATRPKRTFQQAIATKLIKLWFRFATTVEYRTTKSLEAGKDKDHFVLLDPDDIPHSHDSTYGGVLGVNLAIRPTKLAAFWYNAPPPPDTVPELVVLHFHGGAFVMGGARPAEAGWGPSALSKRLNCPVLLPQYRLSNAIDRTTAFPAALQDAVTAYTYLLYIIGVKSGNIVLSGDSAGGNLVLALLRYLEHGQGQRERALPPPRAALLWGPWVDPSVPGREIDANRNVSTDFIFGDLGDWGARCYLPDGWDSDHEIYSYISPLGHELPTDVPVFIQTSTAEVLHDSHRQFSRNMEEKGCRLKYVEFDNAPHDTFMGAPFMGFLKEQEDAIDQAAEFVLEAAAPA
ncbi:hypothetical protein BDW74DRAFT_159719 [Aspergillus multicolor]|uniref:uncharacterized protein n=1 Tax=Aspergillus multicolor TaxID=41759 RepID=UPI003CCD399A